MTDELVPGKLYRVTRGFQLYVDKEGTRASFEFFVVGSIVMFVSKSRSNYDNAPDRVVFLTPSGVSMYANFSVAAETYLAETTV